MGRKLKLVSDGSPFGTRIIDVESGENVENVTSVSVYAHAGELVRVELEMWMDSIEVVGYEFDDDDGDVLERVNGAPAVTLNVKKAVPDDGSPVSRLFGKR